MFPGRGNAGHCAVALYVGEGPRGSNGVRSPLHRISIFHSATHNETGPLWCWFPSGWACVRPRPLWVSPMTSPVRLGVSPAAAPTPMGVFNHRFEALFPRTGALVPAVCPGLSMQMWGRRVLPAALPAPFSAALSPALSVYLCSVRKCRVAGSASGQTACPVGPTLCQSRSRHGNSSPLRPSCPSPPLLLVWMKVHFFISWVSDFLAVQFSVNSGCARRRSVSTYAAILVLLPHSS